MKGRQRTKRRKAPDGIQSREHKSSRDYTVGRRGRQVRSQPRLERQRTDNRLLLEPAQRACNATKLTRLVNRQANEPAFILCLPVGTGYSRKGDAFRGRCPGSAATAKGSRERSDSAMKIFTVFH